MRRLARLALSALALSACAVGPNYRPPPTPPTAAQPFVSQAPAVASAQPPPHAWWTLYDDPALNRLVAEALVENDDLKTAQANLAYAQALLGEARAGLFPSTQVTAGATYGRSATALAFAPITGAPAANSWTYTAGFNAAWEIDLFGRIRRGIEAAHANAQAAEDARDQVRVTVAAETAGAYANACTFGEGAAVARNAADVAQQAYDLLDRERTIGTVSDLDIERQATLLAQAKAAVPVFEGQRRAALFELAALLGRTPATLPPEAAACVTPPSIATPLPVGDGAALLKRRPDVRQAERNLAAATARIGVAEADYFPTVSLNGAVNSAAGTISGLGSAGALAFGVGPLLTWSFPNVLVAHAHVQETTAQTSAAIATFDSTVLTALKETEQALTAYAAELERHTQLTAARDHAQRAYDIARIQYRDGAASFLDVLTAEQTLVQVQLSLAQSDQALVADQVSVFQALGGGWEDAPPVVPPQVPGAPRVG
jgi:NodT family efflux transporter outer membrane factor (OMF) lipoprotein